VCDAQHFEEIGAWPHVITPGPAPCRDTAKASLKHIPVKAIIFGKDRLRDVKETILATR
jgi:hypothetical protein